jgi:adenosine deaminase
MFTSPGASDLRASLASLPKIDLHRHLEGALRLSTLQEIARQHDLGLPADDLDALRRLVQITDDAPTHRNFLAKFDVLRRFYQSPELIHRLAYEVVEDAARDGLRYLELRFTPLALARARGYALAEVCDWVIEAVEAAGRAYPALRVGLIVSLNRHEPLAAAEQATDAAAARLHRGVAAIDLAGDEAGYPAEPFEALFRAARSAGLALTAHAGEWTGALSVRHAIERLGASRIGHGVRVVEDPDVVALARERGIVFEVCPTSNVQSGVVASLAQHPLPAMLALGLQTSLNTDDPAVSGITLTGEYVRAVTALGLSLPDLQRLVLTAAAGAFLPPAQRAELVRQFRQELGLAESAV